MASPLVSDSRPAVGMPFTLSATVRNDGDGDAAGTTVRYYRSVDSTITASDAAVGTDAVTGLGPSGSGSESVDLTAPSSAGRYYHGACVDAVTGESDTTNNCSASVQVDVPEPPPPTTPDLVVASPSVSDSGPGHGDVVHAVGDGAQRRGRRVPSHDTPVLPVGRRDDHDIRYASWYRCGGGAYGVGERQRVGGTDRAVYRGKVLLRRVRGHGDRRVGHDEQLLGDRSGGCVGALAVRQPGLGGGVAFGRRHEPGYGGIVHAIGDGEQQRRRGIGGDNS